MPVLTVTGKGQVTLRKELLQHLGVQPGDKIAVEILPEGRIEVRAARRTGHISDIFGVLKRPGQSVNVRVPVDVALYILNSKRGTLSTLELKNSLSINIVADDHVGPQHFAIEKGEHHLRGELRLLREHARHLDQQPGDRRTAADRP